MDPINRLDASAQEALIAEGELLRLRAGEAPGDTHATGKFCVFLLEGAVEVLMAGQAVKIIDARDKAAGQALEIPDGERYRMRTQCPATILRIDRGQIEKRLRRREASNKLSDIRRSQATQSKVAIHAARRETAMNEMNNRTHRPDAHARVDSARPAPASQAAPDDDNLEEPIARDLYDETFIGKSLADLIDQIHARHDELAHDESASMTVDESDLQTIDLGALAPGTEVDLPLVADEQPAVLSLTDDEPGTVETDSPPATERDELTALMAEFESRLRRHVADSVRAGQSALHAQMTEQIERVKRAALDNVRARGEAMQRRYHEATERQAHAYQTKYDKLMGLAHRISRQKAQIQRARKELGDKLQATERLRQEIDGLRSVLSERIDDVDRLEDEAEPET